MTQREEKEEVCETCGGDRVIGAMEQVYAGEPHMANIGEQLCPDCSLEEDDDHDPDL